MLKNYTNKARLNALICEQVLNDNDFLHNSMQNHKLVVTVDKSEPTQVSEGQKTPRVDLSSTHEEADIFLTQQAIHIAKEDPESFLMTPTYLLCYCTSTAVRSFNQQ